LDYLSSYFLEFVQLEKLLHNDSNKVAILDIPHGPYSNGLNPINSFLIAVLAYQNWIDSESDKKFKTLQFFTETSHQAALFNRCLQDYEEFLINPDSLVWLKNLKHVYEKRERSRL
jgi:hypothetical protein